MICSAIRFCNRLKFGRAPVSHRITLIGCGSSDWLIMRGQSVCAARHRDDGKKEAPAA